MKDVTLKDGEIPVSYDVKSLFTNIPVEETVTTCECLLHADGTLNKRSTMDVSTAIALLR